MPSNNEEFWEICFSNVRTTHDPHYNLRSIFPQIQRTNQLNGKNAQRIKGIFLSYLAGLVLSYEIGCKSLVLKRVSWDLTELDNYCLSPTFLTFSISPQRKLFRLCGDTTMKLLIEVDCLDSFQSIFKCRYGIDFFLKKDKTLKTHKIFIQRDSHNSLSFEAW